MGVADAVGTGEGEAVGVGEGESVGTGEGEAVGAGEADTVGEGDGEDESGLKELQVSLRILRTFLLVRRAAASFFNRPILFLSLAVLFWF